MDTLFWAILGLVVGLVLGLLLAWFYWRRRAGEYQVQVRDLQASGEEREGTLRALKASLQEHEAAAERLRDQMGRDEAYIRDLRARTRDQEEAIGQLEAAVNERDRQVEGLEWRAERAEARVGELRAILLEEEREDATEPEWEDLKRIEGIGPKISALLQEAGITTFAQLATTDLGRLEQILSKAGLGFANPSTWSQQALLAAAGDWAALQVLQDELKGGRPVEDAGNAQPPGER
jgi:predicted flap endonuclease-1-like 5' DNA nuclease